MHGIAAELLWEFDAVQRLAEAQIAGAVGSLILGQAPADPAAGPAGDPHEEVSNLLRTRLEVQQVRSTRPPLVGLRLGRPAQRQAGRSGSPIPTLDGEANPGNGWVVLIDEIDKAEADLPNGLLERSAPVSLRPRDSTNRSGSRASSPWSSSPPTRSACCPMRSSSALLGLAPETPGGRQGATRLPSLPVRRIPRAAKVRSRPSSSRSRPSCWSRIVGWPLTAMSPPCPARPSIST